MTKQPVTYVLPFNSHSGGVKVICHHAAGLRRRGWDCVVLSMQPKPDWFDYDSDLEWHNMPQPGELGAALKLRRGCKVATWWETASWVDANMNGDDSGFYLVQDFDAITYNRNESAQADSHCYGLTHIVESEWVRRELKARYNVDSVNVGIGLDFAYRELPCVRGPRRLLTPARTITAGRADLKGWDVAREVLRRAAEVSPGIECVTFGQENIDRLEFLPHVHINSPNNRKLCELYSSSTVFLACSRHEGFGLPMAEAMLCGAAVVCTNANGNMQFCHHEKTCLVGGDVEELARHVRDLIDRPAFARRLAEAGQAGVRRYYWPAVVDRLETLFAADAGKLSSL